MHRSNWIILGPSKARCDRKCSNACSDRQKLSTAKLHFDLLARWYSGNWRLWQFYRQGYWIFSAACRAMSRCGNLNRLPSKAFIGNRESNLGISPLLDKLQRRPKCRLYGLYTNRASKSASPLPLLVTSLGNNITRVLRCQPYFLIRAITRGRTRLAYTKSLRICDPTLAQSGRNFISHRCSHHGAL